MAAMYQLLAQDCGDTLAIFAYAAYKQHKVEVLRAILEETGAPATQTDMDTFYRTASAPSMRAMYAQKAEALMKRFVDKTLERRRRELESSFTETKIGEQLAALRAAQQMKRSWKGWAADVSAIWRSIS